VEEQITERQYATLKSFEALMYADFAVCAGYKYRICGKHILVVGNVIEPPHAWKEHLDGMTVFIPWPDILMADHFGPDAEAVLMVQPHENIARSILSLYIYRFGPNAVERL
jgi:hypothetical protein